ncbi:hypothetical protein BO70DRAFT_28252 [Aspergillus heteromorphus CBS 117.55]|uniref:Uncharacterized protein n=1 Tax=Aspergillus heteromorphus CBS 117.55 TaxID=1448321 RepID=A0A317WBH3_9EURO|nr:uncharacterized protein BO70DRAFT_28252 [Aspergillus heteromorphus CBS 117.55]PWY83549.1 hypothetical protein BO70DRAFT_28252 [Aspergillus heteromorphus CBS 117.55]
MSLKNHHLPPRVRVILERQEKLDQILAYLDGTQSTFLTDKELQAHDIEVASLDFLSGESSSPFTVPYFLPTQDTAVSRPPMPWRTTGRRFWLIRWNLIWTACRIGMTGIYCKCGLGRRVTHGRHGTGVCRYTSTQGMGRQRSLASCFETYATLQIRNSRQSHRTLTMVMTPCRSEEEMDRLGKEYKDDCRPSVAELIVLTSWMRGGMATQRTRATKACHKRHWALAFHVVVPTLVISFIRPARVRVLHAYFDNTLKVQATEPFDFDAPNYPDLMESLVRWAYPTVHGDTRLSGSLPSISEDDEDDDPAGQELAGTLGIT